MALNTYAALQTTVLAWAERPGDTAASDKLADCIVLCESRVNKEPNLRVQAMETEATLTLTSGSADLPAAFLAAKRVVANYSSPRTLAYAPPDWYSEAYPESGTDEGCDFYTIIGTTLRSKSSATLGLLYYAKVPALATTDPNWLLTKAPEVYLYGTLLELALALEHDEAANRWGPLFKAAIAGLIGSETFNRGGALAMRAAGPAP